MTNDEIIDLVFAELKSAEKQHPSWPVDPIHAAAILGEEAGELLQATIDFTYQGGEFELGRMKKEAAQCAAMGIRFLMGFDRYERPIDNQGALIRMEVKP